MLVTLPFVLLLLDFWPLQRIQLSTINSKLPILLREKLPFFAISAVSSVATFLVQRSAGAVSALDSLPLSDRLGNAALGYTRYIWKTLWPTNLAVYYPHPGAWPFWKIAGAAFVLGVVTALMVALARKRPFFGVGWFWFVGTLVPVIGIVQVGSQSMADRYAYIPSIGLFIIAAWAGAELVAGPTRQGVLASLAAAVALGGCGILARIQAGYWRSSETLFAHALTINEENYLAHFSLGNALIEKGKTNEGRIHLQRAADLNPSFPSVHGALACLASTQRNYSEAIEHYLEVLKRRPDTAEALNNLAWLLATCPDARVRNGTEAVALAERACKLTGFRRTVFVGTLAAAYAEAGRFSEAVMTAERARQVGLIWGESELIEKNTQLMELYRSGKPYREAQ